VSKELSVQRVMKSKSVIFWDFDGVIKESEKIKSDVFESLFQSFGDGLAGRVKKHHELNQGVSRFEKIPVYIMWAEGQCDQERIDYYCNLFSKMVTNKVIDSDWVPGVFDYLNENYNKQCFVLVTATPQVDIEFILDALNISHFFCEIAGHPARKTSLIGSFLQSSMVSPKSALMIGDSFSDYYAAQDNSVPFLLRTTQSNLELQKKYSGYRCNNFDFY